MKRIMKKYLYSHIFIVVAAFWLAFGHDLKCSKNFCKTYTNEKDCPPMSDACDDQKGEFFTSETAPCGCCNTCMEYIDENGYCSIGSPDTPPPKMMCGPRLSCQEVDGSFRCKRMQTPCFKEWDRYNEGIENNQQLKYVEEPNCDGDGNYGPIKCNVNQTCFCVDENGKRIFGEAIYTESIKFTMNCECSRVDRKFHDMIQFKYPGLSARCLGDGSYDPLQCLNDNCICVEEESGSPMGRTSYNVTEIEYKHIPCYNRHWHIDWQYLHDCEEIQMKFLDEVHETLSKKIYPIEMEIEECQPDGWFKSIVENSKFKFCVDKYNRKIESYSVPNNSEEAKSMNCKCARTQDLLKRNNKEWPECCPNGNFKKIQCRDTGNDKKECYCVDEDGLQIEKEVLQENISKLSCYTIKDKCF